MRIPTSLALVAAAATATAALVAPAAAPALADPVNSHGKAVVPRTFDVVGVGADTDDSLLDQLSVDYNAAHPTHNKAHPWIYSWDAVNPKTLAVHQNIRTKSGCPATVRPQGTGEGLTAFEAAVTTASKSNLCIDFARAASSRASTDPPAGPHGILYVQLASDAETYATNTKTNAPKSLTPAQLVQIYSCTATRWDQVGGTSHAVIHPLLPPVSSGVAKFWLKALGNITAGNCVNRGVSAPQQNQGTTAAFKGANARNVLVPYSVGKYIAQVHHSAACGSKPGKGQNEFGCDEHGKLVLGPVSGVAPTVTKNKVTSINTKFPAAFQRALYDVVFWTGATRDHIPSRLERFFASARAKVKGWFCASAVAKKDITNYGFLTTAACGTGS